MDSQDLKVGIGPSKIGKTTIVRSTCPLNYYQFGFDGMEDFDEYKSRIILNDFVKEVPKFMPN